MSDVILEVSGGIGRITLNRPKAINALDHAMVREIAPALAQWATDDAVDVVLLTGAGERGLCAGGDIVSIYHDAKDGGSGSKDFWREEYILNAAIARFPKPFVAIMDGIVMGGGVGLSAHANTRIVTERSKIAMPEVGIGFVPDVGGTYLLSRAPGEIGTHFALTTARMNAADAIAVGFADHYIPSDKLEDFYSALETVSVGEAVATFSEPAPESTIVGQQGWIDECYARDDVQGIVDALAASTVPEAQKSAQDIASKSPVSLAVTLRSLRRAATLPTLESVLDEEYRVSVASLSSHDLVEGIRAQVVEKDRNPQWQPRTLADVTPEDVDRYFAPLGDAELGLSNAHTEGEQS
ncbi:3-hydroxyisobutyryl-CoA hydrolase [Rhodococcus sp. 06-462-5]|uniref:enoyl-CoA hydratase/isomerase family protein n=1 Tax=unclassified Rhodococcus (in: high G+C Gram-positive bacteria) TaxID=192944 RepID=UPI000B9B066A|nr:MULTISPECIES: enoyl-CoA hydratase/isomerase family protein [unclassified Rhodococcus (in: high G+C Gram-positive bacteria)]OZC64405.1 3-hydroxyisobutyryl-CoA hydrolase [Rhodococcus sp. 06-462-5]OZE70388.1 3-hydroxyisobutyryl-CoA hydrolase [Rhodococcus sp. 02-925g]